MEYAEVKEYLDSMVRDYNIAIKQRHLTNHIRAAITADTTILIYEGMETVADIMGLEIREEKRNVSSGLVYEYSFVYDGVEFVSYEKERMKRFEKNL